MTPMNLETFCLRFQAFLEEKPDPSQVLNVGLKLLGELLSDPRWFQGFFEKLIMDPGFLNRQPTSVYRNEITLHRSAGQSFSVLAYIWEPHRPSPIHDHGSWGLIGSLMEPVREKKYRRLDDGRVEGYAELERTSSEVIEPGRTSHVLPLDEGIHQMGAAAERLAVSVGVYGKSIRQGYSQFFDPAGKTVVRAYPPKLFKKVLAIRALGSIAKPWAEDILKAATSLPVPDYLAPEYQAATKKPA